jgi:uncharacterized RDD family membrane protein YckC
VGVDACGERELSAKFHMKTRAELPPVVVLPRPAGRVLIKRAALCAVAFLLLVPLTPLLGWLALEIGMRVADCFSIVALISTSGHRC